MGVRGEKAAAAKTPGRATVLPARDGCGGTWPPAPRAAPPSCPGWQPPRKAPAAMTVPVGKAEIKAALSSHRT